MSDRIYVGNNVDNLDIADPSDIITKVILVVSNPEDNTETAIEVGDDTGRTLEVSVPWGDEVMAQSILNRVSNYRYQPYTAQKAKLDPSAELGDAVTIGGVVSGIFQQDLEFAFLEAPDVSSPGENEVDNEYKYESPQNRAFERIVYGLGSRITQTATQIMSQVYTQTEVDQITQSILLQTAEMLQATLESLGITSYLRYTTDAQGKGVLILGVEGQNLELHLSNDRVSFINTDTGESLAYITDNRFFMPNATVTETMNFGGYQADATTNGIVWKWVGR